MCVPRASERQLQTRKTHAGKTTRHDGTEGGDRPVLLAAATLATAVLRRRLPQDAATLVVGFLAGSSGWHIDDASEFALLGHAQQIHACRFSTAAPLCSPRAVAGAASSGSLAMVRWLLEHCGDSVRAADNDAFFNATKHNHLHILRWLFAHALPARDKRSGLESGVLYYAIEAGRTAVVEWLCATRPQLKPLYSPFDHACRCGHLPVVRLLDALGRRNAALSKCSPSAMDAAADRGHLAVVQWLHAHRTEGCTASAMDFAAARGHLHVLRWLRTNRAEGCTRRALLNAAAGGHTQVVQWLLDERVVAPVDAALLREAMEFAAYHDREALWSLLARAQTRLLADARPVASHDAYVATRTRLAA